MKKIKRTIRKQKIKDFCIVLLFFLILPYTCSVLFVKNSTAYTYADKSDKKENKVQIEKRYGNQMLNMNEYLLGVLAATIPGEYELETVKAQCILIRSACYQKICELNEDNLSECMQQIKNGNITIDQNDLDFVYLQRDDRNILWHNNTLTEEKFIQAVKETEGMVIYHEDEIINPPFFRLSNGMTRETKELPYLIQVPCKKDIFSDEFITKTTIKTSRFFQTLEFEDISANRKISIIKDSGGYVKSVSIGENIISGEDFRNAFSLCSSSYSIYVEKNEIVIENKGIGHGLGFCQYTANELALEHNDCISLINYFFQNINIQKIV